MMGIILSEFTHSPIAVISREQGKGVEIILV